MTVDNGEKDTNVFTSALKNSAEDLLKLKTKNDDQLQVLQNEIFDLEERLKLLRVQVGKLGIIRTGLTSLMNAMEGKKEPEDVTRVTTNHRKRKITFNTWKPKRVSPQSRVLMPASARARILALLRKGQNTYSDLVSELNGVPRGTISGTLAELKRHGLIKGQGSRRNQIYSLA